MITALISSLVGMIGGLVPSLFQEMTARREHKEAMERLRFSNDLRLIKLQAQIDAEGVCATKNPKETMRQDTILNPPTHTPKMDTKEAPKNSVTPIPTQPRASGLWFVDYFNALLRPLTAFLIMLLFLVTAGLYVWGTFQQMRSGVLTPQEAAQILWGSLVGEAIQAVLGFLFGYRSAQRRPTYQKL